MEAYLASLDQQSTLAEDWQAYKAIHYPYKEVNYMTELEAMELAENKFSPNKREDADVLDNIRQRMFHARKPFACVCRRQLWECDCSVSYTPDEIKMRIYNEWLSHKYKLFKKNWKPEGNKDSGLGYMVLTFNFKPETDIQVVKGDIARIVSLAIFDDCNLTYGFEYYGSENCHPHCHMLVELTHTGTKSKSTIDQKVFQDKKLREYMTIRYQFSWARKDSFKVRSRAVSLAYVQGKKTEDKMEQVEKDKIWRKLNDLEDTYYRPAKK